MVIEMNNTVEAAGQITERVASDLVELLQAQEIGQAIHESLNAASSRAVHGMTFEQALMLAAIEQLDGTATVSLLATEDWFNRAVHTMTSAVNAVDRKGWVRRYHIKGTDRRVVNIMLTNRGRIALNTWRRTFTAPRMAIYRQLPAATMGRIRYALAGKGGADGEGAAGPEEA